MKRGDLLRHLRQHGCHLKREGRSHSLWTNPATGAVEAVPRHTEIPDALRYEVLKDGATIQEVERPWLLRWYSQEEFSRLLASVDFKTDAVVGEDGKACD